ncbi:MAG: isoleucine--tRNA ligase [Cyanobacteriota bacterium]
MSPEQTVDYKNSLNLPNTSLKMKANAASKELETQKWWEDNKIYEKNLNDKDVNNKFILHDGPPYLSSDKIHIGTALNKILKDIVVKYKSQCGYYSPYVPGYDGHGLPIENAVVKNIKGGRSAITPLELRKKCREFAYKNLKGQEINFKRLGVWGHWDEPYVTIAPEFEAKQIRVFSKIAEKGYIYKGLKPVYWCASCETALAEAEVEYDDHTSPSIYVKFPIVPEEAKKAYNKASINSDKPLAIVIWTTTPWTLPANMAVCLHPKLDYVFIESEKLSEVLIIEKDLLDSFAAELELDVDKIKMLGHTCGANLEFINARHPFFDRNSVIILGEHVTTESGTGCVHTAPGHGHEDFEVAIKYKIDIVSPLDNKGVFTEEGQQFAGMPHYKANKAIVETMQENGTLLKVSDIVHSYPHCWRCKKPVLYRATEQWFVNVEKFRDQALNAIDHVTWVPASGHKRIYNMVESRSDWCISRQRAWGVPIPVFYCESCGKDLISPEVIEHVAKIFEKESSDAWVNRSEQELLPPGTRCECGNESFTKENDIMDVWFDSGITYTAVCDDRYDLLRGTPVELYLEGSDQHRGWFQTSLLTSVSAFDQAPYKTVLTHGFVLDASGRKMSKSLGNVVDPQQIVGKYGADVLRMWAASVDYTKDVRIGDNIVLQLVEVYKKLRNTCRFLLGNLCGFDPGKDLVEYDNLSELDKYVLHRLQVLKSQVTEAFDRYEFYRYYQLMQNFAAVDLSSLYFDIIKDTLYTAGTKSIKRRAIQTVLYYLIQDIVRMLVPVTPHMAEDIWQNIPDELKYGVESALLTDWPEVKSEYINEELSNKWENIFEIRDNVTKAIEPARLQKLIGSSLECCVEIFTENNEKKELLESVKNSLSMVFITSKVNLLDNKQCTNSEGLLNTLEEEDIIVYVIKASGTKCERCWKFSESIGDNKEHCTICSSCIQAIS